jgi:hypothetical protein
MIKIFVQAKKDLDDPKFAAQVKSDKQVEKLKAYKYKIVKHEYDKLFTARSQKNNWITAPEDRQKEQKERQKKKIADLKKLNLTQAERLAITSYTNENYATINSAISGDAKWLEEIISSRNEKLKAWGDKLLDASPQGMKDAMAENKKIAKLAQAGLNKLPDLQQDQTLYRGDTFSKEEGQKLTAGNKKTYPHFVSVSEETEIPELYASRKRSVERPVGIVWHITKSQHGKNVASLSANETEKEILFPPNTTFQIDKVLSEKTDDKGIIRELEVHEG